MELRHERIVTGLFILAGALAAVQPAHATPLCGSPGDGNGDCRISQSDYADLAACLSGPAVPAAPECQCYDMNGDGHVDLADATQFQQQFTGDTLIAGCVLPVRPDEPGTLQPTKPGGPDVPYWSIPDSPISDTVYLFSGEFHLTASDLVIRGRGFDFEWVRSYRSKTGPNTVMGNGWDHSYNIWLEPSGNNLVLHDGAGRSDEYLPNPNGTWTHPEFFREIVQSQGRFFMTTHDRATLEFEGFNGLPTQGKVLSSSDRFGNRMTFEYDPALGRLTTIRDTLDNPANPRAITLSYNPDGFIESVTDFTGRQVTYDYYQDPDVGGDDGDLRSVTTPPVVGTPNGNDFPLGKTTVYTYSEGLPDPRLNHNLLTITDPKGQTYLSNTYAQTLSPQDIEFDRVVAQQLGEPQDVAFFSYLPQTPSLANNFATLTCIVNDRMGNVEECSYDYRNRLAMLRRFTGRANPNAPTTDVLNRPVNPLRSNDPAFFETRYEYNDESLLTRVVAPELDETVIVHEGDLDFFAPQRRRAEARTHTRLPGPRGGLHPQIVELYEYDPALNFDTSQVTLHTDGRGNPTEYQYDQAGNLTRAIQPIPSIVDDFAYNPFGQLTLHTSPDNGSGSQLETAYVFYTPVDGHQNGYLRQTIVDAPGLALTTTFEYDSFGNMTRVVDPAGNDTLHDVNQLDQVVRSLSREVVPGAGPRYETLTFYDENDNVVRVDVENRDANGLLAQNSHFTTEYEYEILNSVTRTLAEVDQLTTVVTEYEYDPNRNLTLTRFGEATNGNQPTNTVTTVYDERDLLFRSTRASGHPDESTTQYDYDGNGLLTLRVQGLQGASPREDTYAYDGYNIVTLRGDNFGNQKHYEHDASYNTVRELVLGELVDVPGNAGNVRLSETLYTYDAVNRLTIRGEQFFDSTQAPLTDGESTTIYVYSDSSHVLQITDDNGHASSCTYDTANRRDVCTDAKGNTLRYTYDANSNVVAVEATEKSDAGLPDQVFTDTYGYDGLNRLTIYGDNLGNAHGSLHNSRDLVEQEIDALGNLTTYEYDGLNRLTITGQLLTDTGNGAGLPVGLITTHQTWDDSSRLIGQIDGNGNVTAYGYDPLDRTVFTTFADGTSETYQYDVHDNLVVRIDANGSRIDYAYDDVNRITAAAITPAPGVSNDTTFELYTYDGLHRLVAAQDDDSLVTREYDSLSNRVSETVNGVSTTSTYDGVSNQSQCVYPGGRTIDRAYDELDRVSSISEAGIPSATFSYVGPDRVESRALANGSQTTYQYNGITGVPNRPGDFGVRLPSVIFHNHPLAGPIDIRQFRWDPQYNRTARTNTGASLEHTYEYDSAYRLTRTLVNDISPPAPTLLRDTQYQLDLAGNRNQVINDNCPGLYTMDPASPPADFQMNQYTTTGCDARQYDNNGNWVQQATPVSNELYLYDYKNRLVQHDDVANGVTTTMAYDPFDRRISMEVSAGGPVTLTEFFYDHAHLVMEQDSLGGVTTYVHGDGIDELVQMQRGPDDFFYHCDDLGNVLALTDTNGMVVERYDYQDFGQPEFYDGAGSPIPGSAVGNPYLFAGRRFDSTTELYYLRHRYLDPVAGRFVTRDPLGAWADSLNNGNAYAYAGGNPWTHTDPFGLMNKAQLTESLASGSTKHKHRGHVTILKAQGGGGGGGLACGVTEHFLSGGGGGCPSDRPVRCSTSRCQTPPGTGKDISGRGPTDHKHRGHVTILKAHGGGGSAGAHKHRGHVTILKAQGGAEGADYNSSRSNKSHGIAPPPDDGGAGDGRGPTDHKHRGHVTILKAQGGAEGADYNSSRSNKSHGIALPPGGGGGGMGGAIGHHKHRGHVTILKAPNANGLVDLFNSAASRFKTPGIALPPGAIGHHKHRGHVTILKAHGGGGGNFFECWPKSWLSASGSTGDFGRPPTSRASDYCIHGKKWGSGCMSHIIPAHPAGPTSK